MLNVSALAKIYLFMHTINSDNGFAASLHRIHQIVKIFNWNLIPNYNGNASKLVVIKIFRVIFLYPPGCPMVRRKRMYLYLLVPSYLSAFG